MSGQFTDHVVNDWLDELGRVCWISLHFDSPETAGAYASEFYGDGYVRQSCVFTAASNRAIWNAETIKFTGLAAGQILYVGGWNSMNQGDLLFWDELEDPVRVLRGQGYNIYPHQLALSFS